MSESIKNQLQELLARKKASQNNQNNKLNPNQGKQGKISKGPVGSPLIRKSGRGG